MVSAVLTLAYKSSTDRLTDFNLVWAS